MNEGKNGLENGARTIGHRNDFLPEMNCQSKFREITHSQLDRIQR